MNAELRIMSDEENAYLDNRTNFKILRGLEELETGSSRAMAQIRQIAYAIVERKNFKVQFQLISHLIKSKKLEEKKRTNQISNRLKREATIFQLIKHSNHLISIFPILQTMNDIEA